MSLTTEASGFQVQRADWAQDREALSAVRIAVFVREQGVPEALEWDGQDAAAVHLLAIAGSDGRPVGTARLLATGQIGRMAVLSDWRGRGVGTALLQRLLAIARQDGRPPVFLNAQVAAIPFYLRQGFRTVGTVFEEAGIPHQRMEPAAGLSQPDAASTLPAAERVLGRDAGPLILQDRTSIRATGLRMAAQAKRGLCLLSRDLDPPLYDDALFVDALRHLATRTRGLSIRVLLLDPAAVARRGHRMLPLIHHLTSAIAVRGIPESQTEPIHALFVADEVGYILRPQADLYRAEADFRAPPKARRLIVEFLTIWDQASPTPDLQRLYL